MASNPPRARRERVSLFTCYGLVARVQCEDAAQLAAVTAALGPVWRPAAGVEPDVTFALTGEGAVSRNGHQLPFWRPGGTGVEGLEWGLRHHLAAHAPDHVFIHAGVVSVASVGILIPGRSWSGKSTLVHELVHRGATYHSDEYAVIDRDGLVHPYSRPLTLRTRHEPHHRATASAQPSSVAVDAIRAGLVFATRHVTDSSWNSRRVSRAEGAMLLLDNTVVARSRPAESLTAVRNIMLAAECWQGTRGEADEAAQAILGLAAELAAGKRLSGTTGPGRLPAHDNAISPLQPHGRPAH